MTKKPLFFVISAAVIFLAAAVCLLPLPRAVSYQGTSVVYAPDGTPGHKQDIESTAG